MASASMAALQGVLLHQALMERDADVRRKTLDDVIVRLEGFGVAPSVVAHFRALRESPR